MQIQLGSKGVGGNFDFEALRCLGIASMGGAGVGECLAAIGRIRRDDADSWTNEFGALGDRLVREAERSLGSRDPTSAAEQLTRASTYYRAAAFYVSHGDPRQHRYRSDSRETFHRALREAGRQNVDVLRIPFEGATLPGYFFSAGEGRHPTLLVLGGYDSSAEELMLWLGNACAPRGWNAWTINAFTPRVSSSTRTSPSSGEAPASRWPKMACGRAVASPNGFIADTCSTSLAAMR